MLPHTSSDSSRRAPHRRLVAPTAAADVEGSATVRAYAHDDLLDKRRLVMQAWPDYVAGTR